MNAAEELVSIVEANGGHIRIDGADLVIRPGEAADGLMLRKDIDGSGYFPELLSRQSSNAPKG